MMTIGWKNHLRNWSAALCAVACAGHAGASVCPHPASAQIAIRMDRYFSMPRSPQTYRALSGMGDLQFEFAKSDSLSDWWRMPAAKKLYAKQLFPDLDVSNRYALPEFGHCRMASPMKILSDRMTKFGARHPYVQQWILAERTVLSACGPEQRRPAALPGALISADASVMQLQDKDRAYQYASLLFYENDVPGALQQFEAIASDRQSPLRGLGAYMAAAIRAGTDPLDGWQAKPTVTPAQSIKEIHAILRDASLSEVHPIAAQLIGWIGARSEDATARRAQIHEALSALNLPLKRLQHSPNARLRYAAALSDINFLHRDFADPAWWLNGAVPRDATASRAMADAAQGSDMAAWLLFPASPFFGHPWALAESGERPTSEIRDYLEHHVDTAQQNDVWNHESLAWDRDGLSKGDDILDVEVGQAESCGDDQTIATLTFDFYNHVRHLFMDGAQSTRAQSFATALNRLQGFPFKSTMVYRATVHDSLQYLITKGYLTMARQMRDRLALDRSARGLFDTTDLLIVLAEDEDHLVRALDDTYYSPSEYLNRVAVEELWRLAARSDLPRNQRALYARTAWTRLYALGRIIDGPHDRSMRTLNPELVAHWRSAAGRDVHPEDRVVLGDVLTSPGLNLVMESFARMPGNSGGDEVGLNGMDRENHNDNNWWCAWELDRHARDLEEALQTTFGSLDAPRANYGALTIRQNLAPALRESFVFRSTDPVELRAMAAVDCAPKLLAERTIAWVKSPGWFEDQHGQNEALANAIMAARWGCSRQGSHAAYTREAYRLLHSQFRTSAAAQRTRYWYACPGIEGGCVRKDAIATLSQH